MAKVLLIEPKKVLQQAISLFLFPEHEVKVEREAAASLESLKDYDLVIVDGAALRESNQLTSELLRAVEASKTPTLWLEEGAEAQSPARDKFVVVRKPLEKQSFEAAVADFLSPAGARAGSSLAARRNKGRAAKAPSEKKPAELSEQPAFQFIDLVEVVDEEGSPKQGRKASRKSK